MKIYSILLLNKIAPINIVIIFIVISHYIPVQAMQQVDSLKKMLPSVNIENKDELFNQLSQSYYDNGNYDSTKYFAQKALELAKEQNDLYNLSYGYLNLGKIVYREKQYDKAISFLKKSLEYHKQLPKSKQLGLQQQQGQYYFMARSYSLMSDWPSAIQYFDSTLMVSKKRNDSVAQIHLLVDIGYSKTDIGQTSEGLANFFQAYNIAKSMNDRLSIAKIYLAIGYNHHISEHYSKALVYYKKALNKARELKNYQGISVSCINIGGIHDKNKNYDSALFYYKKALIIQKEFVHDSITTANLYNNLCELALGKENYLQAAQYLQKSKGIYDQLNYPYGKAINLHYFGRLFLQRKQYDKAEEHFLSALQMVEKYNFKQVELSLYEYIFKLYQEKGNSNKALEYHLLFSSLKDSLRSKEVKKQIANLESKHELEKTEKELELANNENKLHKSKLQRQQQFQYFIMGIVLLLLIVILLIYRTLRIRNKANKQLRYQKIQIEEKNEELQQQKEEILTQRDEIHNQKAQIEEKNIHITQSINYALRIQTAILPSVYDIKKYGLDCFVLNIPKDIVSGDFYWFHKQENLYFFSVIDCTGHGVPGAFMTFVANNILNRAVKELKLTQPHEILNFASQQMNLTFQQGGTDSVLKTGMDLAFCTFDMNTHEIKFAGAYNPLYIIRDNKHYELKPDSYPIGLPMDKDVQSYSLKKIQVQKGDMLYLFSDGYADQFGGKKNRKFMMKRFKELLINLHTLHLEKQNHVLQETFIQWKGNNEQIDDVLILGIRF